MNSSDIYKTPIIQSAERKYQISEYIPKKLRDVDPLIPHCSNSYLFQLTKTWDKVIWTNEGSRAVRERILEKFVESMKNATGPQIEKELNNGASLFLTRISAWLRLTYLLGYNLALQIRALTIFVSAASGNRFLTEFLEVGGILTILEILTIVQASEEDKAEALILLIKVAANGRKYKEFICESYGVRQITECLSKSKSEVTQDYARNLLVSMGTGNPRFQIQVFKGLQSLLSSSAVAPTAQQMAAQALRVLLKSSENAPVSLIDPASSLMRSQHMQVQYEGYELLRALVFRSNCQEQILVLLVAVLRNVIESATDERAAKETAGAGASKWTAITTEDQKEKDRLLSGYIQQAYAAKLVGVLIATSEEITEKLISLQLVSALLNVVANSGHPESQRYAVSNLQFLVQKYEYVAQAIRANMGENFYDLLENKPDTFYKELTKEQVRYLRRNNIKIRSQDGNEKEIDSDSDSESDGDGQKTKRTHTIFPGAFPKEEVAPSVEEPKNVEVAPAPISETKLQQQIIIEAYEKSEKEAPKELVETIHIQYQGEVGINSTFPVNKYINSGTNTDQVVFETALEDFRIKNNKKRDQKKTFELEVSENTQSSLVATKQDTQIFSHEKMVQNIEKHMDESGIRQILSSDDQAMMVFETNLGNANTGDDIEWNDEAMENEKSSENLKDQQTELEEELPIPTSGDIGGAIDDWNLEEEVMKNSRERQTPQTDPLVPLEDGSLGDAVPGEDEGNVEGAPEQDPNIAEESTKEELRKDQPPPESK